MSNTETQAEKQKTFYEILEQAVWEVTEKAYANPEFRARRMADFEERSKEVREYKKRLEVSSIVRPEDLKITYNYRAKCMCGCGGYA